MQALSWDPTLAKKYDLHGPRYTSYPTALELRSDFPSAPVKQALLTSDAPLSAYLHVPFCHQLCYYCGCNKIVTRHQHKADRYLDALAAEFDMYSPLLSHRGIQHLHLGGGTPTFLNASQLTRLMFLLRQHLGFVPQADSEVSIEIDPRSCDLDKLTLLRELGFNRVSFGVQDFNHNVQQAINRVQPLSMVQELVEHARALQFESINLDLVYGLPLQTAQNFEHTLTTLLNLRPDRVSLFSYAHLPNRFAAQRKIATHDLLAGHAKQQLLLRAIERLSQAGYQSIGMDHFALPTDNLAKAQRQGNMQRNFQGYTTHGSDCLIGFGVTAISQVNGVMWQHQKDLPAYYAAVDAQQLAVDRGFQLSRDDQIRAAAISQLICHFELDLVAFGDAWQIAPHDDLRDAFEALEPFIADGLVVVTPTRIQVTEQGQLWVRLICACFDAYQRNSGQFSKVI